MATATATTSLAVAAAAATKIIKAGCGGRASVVVGGVQMLRNRMGIGIGSQNLHHDPQHLIVNPKNPQLSARTHLFPSFCTTANVNAEESTAASASDPATVTVSPVSESRAVSDGDEKKDIKDVANLLDIRVGRIIKAWRHEEADTLYVEEVDVGEAEPRTICSGLVNYITLDHLQDRKVVVLANLKPRNMRGVKSNGMLMAASDASHENVELLEPPEDSVPGERIWFGSEDDKQNQPDPATPNQIQKKKIWESVQPHLKTNDSCIAMLGENIMQTSAGVVVCKSLKNANIS